MDSPEFVLERKVAQAHAMYQAEHAQLHEHDVGYLPGFLWRESIGYLEIKFGLSVCQKIVCAAAPDVMKMRHNIIIRCLN